eukprot:CAMPEP_0119300328 /NCGR_PEP_ID=MMETSP1333-20130426/2281_1 /TAXON_ID=418940 /ORGANISM="Scyphosphaera apsteinii, Strain RCC1455" /LENGTH=887 /DNA_ID=CAMNT_0007302051 /DNA_START=233 /DNA_END=2893 /DNA_ORIENTATION=-
MQFQVGKMGSSGAKVSLDAINSVQDIMSLAPTQPPGTCFIHLAKCDGSMRTDRIGVWFRDPGIDPSDLHSNRRSCIGARHDVWEAYCGVGVVSAHFVPPLALGGLQPALPQSNTTTSRVPSLGSKPHLFDCAKILTSLDARIDTRSLRPRKWCGQLNVSEVTCETYFSFNKDNGGLRLCEKPVSSTSTTCAAYPDLTKNAFFCKRSRASPKPSYAAQPITRPMLTLPSSSPSLKTSLPSSLPHCPSSTAPTLPSTSLLLPLPSTAPCLALPALPLLPPPSKQPLLPLSSLPLPQAPSLYIPPPLPPTPSMQSTMQQKSAAPPLLNTTLLLPLPCSPVFLPQPPADSPADSPPLLLAPLISPVPMALPCTPDHFTPVLSPRGPMMAPVEPPVVSPVPMALPSTPDHLKPLSSPRGPMMAPAKSPVASLALGYLPSESMSPAYPLQTPSLPSCLPGLLKVRRYCHPLTDDGQDICESYARRSTNNATYVKAMQICPGAQQDKMHSGKLFDSMPATTHRTSPKCGTYQQAASATTSKADVTFFTFQLTTPTVTSTPPMPPIFATAVPAATSTAASTPTCTTTTSGLNAVCTQINSRFQLKFARGSTSPAAPEQAGIVEGLLQAGGILVHGIGSSETWLPCPPSEWCPRFRDRVSASLINRQLPFLHRQYDAGLIVNARYASVLCAYDKDSYSHQHICGTFSKAGCIPGCPTESSDVDSLQLALWHYELDGTLTRQAYRGNELNEMIAAQLVALPTVAERSSSCRSHDKLYEDMEALTTPCLHNEVVLDGAAWEDSLPDIIEAVIFPEELFLRDAMDTQQVAQAMKQRAAGEAHARQVHANFMRMFGISPAKQSSVVPLLAYNKDWHFREVPNGLPLSHRVPSLTKSAMHW